MEYLFNFDNTFEIHDDMEVLKKMKMTMGLENGTISSEDLRLAKNMVPKALQSNVEEMAKQGTSDEPLVPKVTFKESIISKFFICFRVLTHG